MFEIDRAIILAAGKGTRLKSFTQTKPKALMQIAGQAAIARVIHRLVRQGIHDIAINIHHHAEQIKAHLGHGSRFNANLYYSAEPTLLDSGGGARTALDLLPSGERVLIHNADVMADIDVSRLAQHAPGQGCTLALVHNPKHHPSGDFSLSDTYISTDTPKPYTFAGVSIWHDEVLREYPRCKPFPMIDPIHACIRRQQCLGMVHQGHWFDIGRPHDLIQAHHYYAQHAL